MCYSIHLTFDIRASKRRCPLADKMGLFLRMHNTGSLQRSYAPPE
jgi:hypothetical protein